MGDILYSSKYSTCCGSFPERERGKVVETCLETECPSNILAANALVGLKLARVLAIYWLFLTSNEEPRRKEPHLTPLSHWMQMYRCSCFTLWNNQLVLAGMDDRLPKERLLLSPRGMTGKHGAMAATLG